MTITLHTWSTSDKPALISLCNVVDRAFLSDRLPNPYTKADADWWLGMVVENDGKQGIGTEAVRQICGIAFQELALDRIIGQVFPENVASVRVLEKNGFRLEETVVEKVIKSGMARDVKLYRKDNFF